MLVPDLEKSSNVTTIARCILIDTTMLCDRNLKVLNHCNGCMLIASAGEYHNDHSLQYSTKLVLAEYLWHLHGLVVPCCLVFTFSAIGPGYAAGTPHPSHDHSLV